MVLAQLVIKFNFHMLNTDIKYSYNDVTIIPAIVSEINHRSECNPFTDDMKLPIFTAPMSTVINENNFDLFNTNLIYAILPRSVDYNIRLEFLKKGKWVSLSLNEFNYLFNDNSNDKFLSDINQMKVLVDIANGHMKSLYDSVSNAKVKYGNKLYIMVGNIANPETYKLAFQCGASYVRCGIGGGYGCITSSNTGIHYPMASLISEISKIKQELAKTNDEKVLPKIVADGGIRNYNDVIKALALGADYVMIGSIFSSLIESSASIYIKNENDYIKLEENDEIIDNGSFFSIKNNCRFLKTKELYKKFYGMASKDGQIDLCGKKIKTSEGVTKYIKVTTNLHKWIDNMIDYMKSAMSYTNIKNLHQFKNVNLVVISNNTYNSVNK